MKLRIRRSSLKPRRKHGFRAKPWSYMPKKHKRKPGGARNRRGRVAR